MIAEMHAHTKDCGHSNLSDYKILKSIENIDYIAITDHGTVEPSLRLRKLSKKIITGAEYISNKGEIIGYNIRQDPKSNDFWEIFDSIKDQGGQVSIPHPFDYFRKTAMVKNTNPEERKQILKKADFIEVNARCFFFANLPVLKNKYNRNTIAGSDAHFPYEIGLFKTDIEFGNKIKVNKIYFNGFSNPVIPKIYSVINKRLNK